MTRQATSSQYSPKSLKIKQTIESPVGEDIWQPLALGGGRLSFSLGGVWYGFERATVYPNPAIGIQLGHGLESILAVGGLTRLPWADGDVRMHWYETRLKQVQCADPLLGRSGTQQGALAQLHLEVEACEDFRISFQANVSGDCADRRNNAVEFRAATLWVFEPRH